MDETFPRKRGRPRNPPATSPIIATTIRSRVTRTIGLTAPTAHELDLYVAWASAALHIARADAMLLTIDRAIVDLLRKDRLWQQERGRFGIGRGESVGSTPTEP